MMKKSLLLLVVLLSAVAFAKPAVVVSILPQKTFVEKIAKERVAITVMVSPGSSPHTYEPKASQMIALSKAEVYFSIGVEFEEVWLQKFQSQNPHLRIVNISDNIPKIAMVEYHHGDEHDTADAKEHQHDGLDPHTWTSPENVAMMAETIYKILVQLDPENQTFYKNNLDIFIKEISATDTEIKRLLKEAKPKSTFMVLHPSWGYFANAYDLTQVAIEVEGKSPTPKEMIMIIEKAKEQKVRVIFTQPEFSDKYTRIIAKEANVTVKKISPLNADWSQNLIHMAKSIARK